VGVAQAESPTSVAIAAALRAKLNNDSDPIFQRFW
jgi:hypothetical protein